MGYRRRSPATSAQRATLTLRDVELASRAFAYSFDNEEFAISRTQLSQIETRDALPNIFRLFSISQIYKIELIELMSWYGVANASAPMPLPRGRITVEL